MSFLNNDKFWLDTWLDTVQFINQHLKFGDKLLVTTEFGEKINNIFNYSSSRADNINDFQSVIIHKRTLNPINSSFLKQIAQSVNIKTNYLVFSKTSANSNYHR